ncbi:MAG: monovalent cation/H+ antiporter subunit D family protein [Chloroflexi bacterium]|nr:monovalent cation/H+ antiporter subunit D family protein [Chloroflexota bacterium]
MTTAFDSPLPVLAVAAPLIGGLLVAASGRRPNLREAWTLLASLATIALVTAMLPKTLDGRHAQSVLFDLIPGVPIALRADAAGMLFALLAAVLWLATSLYSIGYMRALEERKQTRYYCAFALSISSALGVALADNLLTFVLFYELLSIVTYPLVIHHETPEALRAGRKYLFYTLSGGLALIGAVAWAYASGLDIAFRPDGAFSSAAASDATLWGLFALLSFGVGVKAAVMPLHSWLPSAMVAPTPVSALLHAVAVVKAGAFGFVRVIGFVFGVGLLKEMGAWGVLAGFAGATLIISSLLALRIDHLKRRLAYSTISHLSYIVLGTALLGPAAWTGALLHIVAHGFTKITLFFCAGAIHVTVHKDRVSELKGIGRQMPLTMGAFTIASLGMIGMPPLTLFASKWFLGTGAVEQGQEVFLFLYLIGGLLAAGYLLPIVARAYLWRSPHFASFREAPRLMLVPLLATAALTIIWGLAPDLPFHFLELSRGVARAVTGGAP